MKIVCGKCSAECELPKDGGDIQCPSCAALFRMPSLADGEELPHPDTFPGYRILAIIGHGGMGRVYRAIQLSMDREVAIKVLRKKLSSIPRFVQRFAREATALAALNHPNIVAVIDRGQVGDTYYFVMEYVHGRTLRHLVRANKLGVERTVEITIHICQALEAAHGAGVVHRDIKPGNVLVEEDGLVKVADFGIAHVLDDEATPGERRSRLGTAKYMAPEQKGIGAEIDPRADLYALGVTLHEMLTGSLPKGEPARQANPLVPPALDEVCNRAMRQQREERFATAADMRQALEHVLADLRRPPEAAAPPLNAPRCRLCDQPVGPADAACPHCEAVLAEACYREDCDGVNPVGAERCARCNGHVELLRHRRRVEFDGLLKRAAALAGEGDYAAALDELDVVLGDSHADFVMLRDSAQAAAHRIRLRRRGRLLRAVAQAAAALLLIAGAGLASYWAVHTLAARKPPVEATIGDDDDDDVTPDTPGPRPATNTAGPVTPSRPRRPLREYLVALTGPRWSAHPPQARVLVAAEASRLLERTAPNSADAKALARTLDQMEQGNLPAPIPRVLHAQLDRALGVLVDALAADLRRHPALADAVRDVLDARTRQRQRAPGHSLRRLEVAASTLAQLGAAAEMGLRGSTDVAGRWLLLDVAVAAAQSDSRDLTHVANHLVRAARLLVRYLQQDGRAREAPELLADAGQRLALARSQRPSDARLAYSPEAIVEALAARRAF